MANERRVVLTIVGDSKSAQKSLTDLGATAGTTEVKLSGFGKAFAGIGSSLASAVIGFAAVSKAAGFVGSALDEAGKGQQQLDQLGAVLKSTGGAAGVTAQQAIDLSKSLQAVTTYSDQAVLGGENLLLTFTNIGQDIFPQATAVILDMSTAMGQDLKSSALQVGKALQDPITGIAALHDVGVNFTAQQIAQVKAMVAVGDTAGAQQIILAELNKEFGGSAQAAAQGYTGQIKQLTNQYNDLKEAIGTAALPALTDFTKALSNGAKSNEFQSFIGTLSHDIQVVFTDLQQLLSGHLPTHIFTEWALTAGKEIFLVAAAFNDTLKAISGGKINIDGPLRGLRDGIVAQEASLKADLDAHVAKPIADGLSGKSSGSQIAPAKVQAYGAELLASYIKGLTSAQTGDFTKFAAQFEGLFKGADGKTDANAFAGATATLAMALDELAKKGAVSNDTMLDLSSQFGLQVPEVYKLLQAYAAMGGAQEHAKATTEALATAQGNLASVTAQAASAAAAADTVIAAAQATAAQHSEAAAAAIDGEQRALHGVADAAGEAARASAARVDALQGDLERAQAAQTAASEQRQRDSAIAQAAIHGETEAYLRQTDTLTEQDRKLAEHYETIIGGERRAKDAADARINGLNHAANKEDLDFLTKIRDARQSGHAKEANALQRQFDARKKQRGGEMEIARAQAAVAGDEYDDKVKQIDQESKGRDELDAKNEKAAAARVAAIQADIKGVQDAAKAEADRYAAQQRGIQDEIDRLTDAAKVQAGKDAAAILAAQGLKTEIALQWSIANTGATVALGLAQGIATAHERSAAATKETYEHTKDTVDLHNANPAAFAPPATVPAPAPPRNLDPEFNPGGGTALPTTLPPGSGTRQQPADYAGPGPNPSLYLGTDGKLHPYAPGDSGGYQNTSLGGGGALSLREAGSAATAVAGDGGVTINIHAPNLTDIGSAAQQRALGLQLRREWQQQARGGATPQGA